MGGSARLQLLLLLVSVLALSCRGQQLSSNQADKTSRVPGLDVCGKGLNPVGKNWEPAVLGAYPWMANIGFTRIPDGDKILFLCGGSLITDQYVVSAAQCFHPSTLKRHHLKIVRLGDLDLNPDVQDGATPTDCDIEKFIAHDGYNFSRRVSDIALIKLKDKVTFTTFIRPICLPPRELYENQYIGFFPVVAGWGKNTLSGPVETALVAAEVKIEDTDGCRRNLTSIFQLPDKDIVIDHRVICASSVGKDACQGFGGGPLMLHRNIKRNYTSKTGNYFLLGIVSYGFKCGEEGYPNVYTRVSEYTSWLLDNMDI